MCAKPKMPNAPLFKTPKPQNPKTPKPLLVKFLGLKMSDTGRAKKRERKDEDGTSADEFYQVSLFIVYPSHHLTIATFSLGLSKQNAVFPPIRSKRTAVRHETKAQYS